MCRQSGWTTSASSKPARRAATRGSNARPTERQAAPYRSHACSAACSDFPQCVSLKPLCLALVGSRPSLAPRGCTHIFRTESSTSSGCGVRLSSARTSASMATCSWY
eukprot:scaffold28876_cov72-Phaeocystis_antarctica.AAC.4